MRLFGVVGLKDAGKTGLVERLVTEFTARGLSVATLKHAHDGFEIDRPGTDSARHAAAGARQVLVAGPSHWALMTRAPEPPLSELLTRLDPADLILIEGWKREPHPKIEVHRAATGHKLLAPGDPTIRAVAADHTPEVPCPVLPLDDTVAIAEFILRETGL